MRRVQALTATALLALGPAACGSSSSDGSSPSPSVARSSGTTSTAAASKTISLADGDGDNDVGAPHDDTSNARGFRAFGRPANRAEQRAVSALVKRYYVAALAGDGARGCSMLYSTLAEAAVEDDAQPPGPSYLAGAKSCAAVLHLLFEHFHAQLAAEIPKLTVAHVRVKERQGLVLLRFGALPEREISVKQEGKTWKMDTIYDQELP